MKWTEAREYAAKLDAHSHKDWRLPTKGELAVLFNNCAAIGRFDISGYYPDGRYWSDAPLIEWNAWVQDFCYGYQKHTNKDNRSSVRCLR